MSFDPCVLPAHRPSDEVPCLGPRVLDRYVQFVAARCRRNTELATVSDLPAFFTVVPKEPSEVVVADVFAFIHEQRQPRGDGQVVRLADGESGLSSRTIKRRLSTLSGLLGWLVMLGELSSNPVPRSLATRRQQGRRNGVPLIRTPRTLPQVLDPAEVDALLKALRRWRDRTTDGLDQIVLGARGRAGSAPASCHELRHTCLTRLREAGMALEAMLPGPGGAGWRRAGLRGMRNSHSLATCYRRHRRHRP